MMKFVFIKPAISKKIVQYYTFYTCIIALNCIIEKDQHSILYESGLVVYKALKRTRWHLDVVKFAGRANQYWDGESTCDATVATLTSDTTLQQVVFEKQGNQRNPGDAKKPSWAKFNMQRDWFDCLGWNVFTDCSHIKSEDICCFQTPLPQVTNDI